MDNIQALKTKIELLENKANFTKLGDYSNSPPPVPWLYFDEEHQVFVNQNSVGVFLKVNGFNYRSIDSSKLEDLYLRLFPFFNALGDNYTIQFHEVHTSNLVLFYKNLEQQIQEIENLLVSAPSAHLKFLLNQKKDQLANFRQRSQENINPPKQIEHYISIYKMFPPMFDTSALKFFFNSFFGQVAGRKKVSFVKNKSSLREFFEDFTSSVGKIVFSLNSLYSKIGVDQPVKRLSQSELILFLRKFFDYDLDQPVLDQDIPLTSQIHGKDLFYSLNGFHFKNKTSSTVMGAISDKRTMSLYLTNFPKVIGLGCLSELSDLHFDFILTSSFFKDPMIGKKRDRAQMINIQMKTMGSQRGITKFHKEQIVYDQKIGQEDNHGFLSSVVLSFLGDEKYLSDAKATALEVFKSKYLNCPVEEDVFYGPYTYLSSLPFGFHPKLSHIGDRTVKILSESARSILPFYGNHPVFPKEESYSGMMFQTAEGSVKFIDPNYLSASAKHHLIVGETGSGKSFFMNYCIEWFINQGGAAFCVDPGGSFEPNIVSHGGEFYNISDDQPFKANIFHGELFPLNEDGETSNYKFNLLVNFISIMYYGLNPSSDEKEINKARSIIGDALKSAYEEIDKTSSTVSFDEKGGKQSAVRIRNVTLSVVVSKIQSDDFPDLAKDIRAGLKVYCKGGQYGHYFDEDYPPLDNHIMGINLKSVESDQKLCTLLLILFTSHASNVFEKNMAVGKKELSVLVIDEIHKFLHGSFMKDFIETQLRELRKFGVAFFGASQSLSHFVSNDAAPNPAGEECLNSTHYWVLLQQDDYLRRFAGDPNRALHSLPKETISSICDQKMMKGKGGYAPFYYYSKKSALESGFFRYFASPREIVTYSSDPKERHLRLKCREEVLKTTDLTGADLAIESLNLAVKEF